MRIKKITDFSFLRWTMPKELHWHYKTGSYVILTFNIWGIYVLEFYEFMICSLEAIFFHWKKKAGTFAVKHSEEKQSKTNYLVNLLCMCFLIYFLEFSKTWCVKGQVSRKNLHV